MIRQEETSDSAQKHVDLCNVSHIMWQMHNCVPQILTAIIMYFYKTKKKTAFWNIYSVTILYITFVSDSWITNCNILPNHILSCFLTDVRLRIAQKSLASHLIISHFSFRFRSAVMVNQSKHRNRDPGKWGFQHFFIYWNNCMLTWLEPKKKNKTKHNS